MNNNKPISFFNKDEIPNELFEKLLENCDPQEILSLTATSKDLNERINQFRIKNLSKKQDFDTQTTSGLQKMKKFLEDAKRMNVIVEISLNSFSNIDIITTLYDFLDNIKIVDLSKCTPVSTKEASEIKLIKDLLDPVDPDERWVKDLLKGKKMEAVIFPPGYQYSEEEKMFMPDTQTTPPITKKGMKEKVFKPLKKIFKK